MTDDAGRDPIAEQEEAARVFEERTGRKSTDPAPPGVMRMGLRPDGTIQVDTYGYERDPNDEFDPFKRAGIERTHHAPSEIEETPTGVFGRFPAGTDPKAAVREVVNTMFPGATEVSADGYARKPKYPGAIDADVIEDDTAETTDPDLNRPPPMLRSDPRYWDVHEPAGTLYIPEEIPPYPCVCGHERSVHALVPHGDCWVEDCGCTAWSAPEP